MFRIFSFFLLLGAAAPAADGQEVNGEKAGSAVDLFNDGVIPAEPIDLGVFALKEKDNQLAVEIVGTNEKARPKAYMFGLDYLVLKPAGG
jgi:hypothetical protein